MGDVTPYGAPSMHDFKLQGSQRGIIRIHLFLDFTFLKQSRMQKGLMLFFFNVENTFIQFSRSFEYQ